LTTIKMPQLGESVTEGTIERWLVKEGDTVEQYDPLFEVVTDKVNAEVPAEVAGTITKIMVPDGETVKVGENFGLRITQVGDVKQIIASLGASRR
jgi:2-oxoisovalerate dehydrogenase E2 component (dihydrolipoyl transacylase)